MAEAKERAAPPPLHPTRKHLAESQRNVWDCDIEVGTSPEDLLNPAYWAHNAREFRVMERYLAHAQTRTLYPEHGPPGAVLDIAKVAPLGTMDPPAVTPRGPS